MGALSRSLAELADQLTKRAADEQGGVISGDNPSKYDPKDPIRLWVIQVVIIITTTQLLSLLLSRMRQPRVIAEVIAGILLGPTVMGRIPGFKNKIFPNESMPLLTLTATIGLVLFLFLVGLEIDTRVLKRNAKASSVVSIAGLVIPLGMGAGLGAILYPKFIASTVNFGYFILFTAVAIGITAFPVLCRILTELKLLDTTVGTIVLAAGVGNDVVGWVLLALTVALVNASSGLTALWVLLASVGYVIFLLYPVRWAFKWLARRTGSLSTGQPTAFMMTVTLLVVFASAFFTDIIGVHAIFGGFLAGLIIPHENGFAIALVEKFEDLVCILLLPLYFTLSGLRTNLGLLNNGITWGYTILICVFAFISKFFACAIAARLFGFNLRESSAIGSLMSCKGLVELIVLNIGLQAGILDTRVFSMFVVHALVLTFMTTPLVIAFYPEKYRVHTNTTRAKPALPDGESDPVKKRAALEDTKTKFSIVLDRIDQLSAAMTLTQLLQPPVYDPSTSSVGSISEDIKMAVGESSSSSPTPPLTATAAVSPTHPHPKTTIDALRLIELTERTSAVLKSQAADALLHSDPVVSVFRTFGYLNRLPVSAALSVVPYNDFATSIASHVREAGSEMVILPWARTVSADEHQPSSTGGAASSTPTAAHYNPFEGIFKQSAGQQDGSSTLLHSELVRKVFMSAPCDVALFLDRGIISSFSSVPPSCVHQQHLFLPFFGGPDDRLALTFVVQLCVNPAVTATVVKMEKTDVDVLTPMSTVEAEKLGDFVVGESLVGPRVHYAKGEDGHREQHATIGAVDTVYGHRDTQTQLASVTADNLLWDKYAKPSDGHSPSVASALSRITFTTKSSPTPLHAMVELASAEVSTHAVTGRTIVVVVGRSRRMAVESHGAELRQLIADKHASGSGEACKTLGDVGAAVIAGGTAMSLLVLQTNNVGQ